MESITGHDVANANAREAALRLWNPGPGVTPVPLWLDCDTGHDDAFAILLAACSPAACLLGVSTVHGNASLDDTTKNTCSVLRAIGRPDVPVFPGAVKPLCRDPVHAESIHGASGLDGTTLLPDPGEIPPMGDNLAVNAMYTALKDTPPQTAWLITTGTLTNAALFFAMYPSMIEHLAGLSIMGGVVGGFFTHAPLGKLSERVELSEKLHKEFPTWLSGDSVMTTEELGAHFRGLGLLKDQGVADDKLFNVLDKAKESFGNWSPYAEFNIFCDPEAAASIFTIPKLAAKTTLIPLDVTHQVLANRTVLDLLRFGYEGDKGKTTGLRILFQEICTFFAGTYDREFGMDTGPPLHDPIAVAAAIVPEIFDDLDGERFAVHVVREGDAHVEQCGRTIVKRAPKGQPGVRIPRTLHIPEFWHMIDLSLAVAEKRSPCVLPS
ncbi:nucleoside hydrolase [Trichodelitschia bisporula]|uniref:Nucleoside hydrolase n=1 Tax=Trichodelitschia bisporula TaxID=703511 RepID=A0A6G1I5V9_9PEZI|nr:nucleoside hydrolase [Trichodelitschia bisporula]